MEKGVVVIVCNKDRNTYVTKHDIREIKNLLNFKKRLIEERKEELKMKETIEDIIEQMLINYDICYSDKMTPNDYKQKIIKGINELFEKSYYSCRYDEDED